MDINGYRAWLAWVNSQNTGSRMQRGTRNDFDRVLTTAGPSGRLTTIAEIACLPQGLSSPWRLLFRTMRRQFTPVRRRLLVRLAMFDRIAHRMTDLKDEQENERLRRRIFTPSLTYWQKTGFELPWRASVALDMTLQHLAWMDVQLNSNSKPPWPAGGILALAEPTQLPMRHWFDGLLAPTNCANLVEFYDFLGNQKALRLGRVISHDLLKKWASTLQLMPHPAVCTVLEACKPMVDDIAEHLRLWIARLLTFLYEFIGSFSATPVDEKASQKAVHERLVQLCAEFGEAEGVSGRYSDSSSP